MNSYTWGIENNIIFLKNCIGNIYFPSAKDFYNNINSNEFLLHDSAIRASSPFKELGIHFSKIGMLPQISVKFLDGKIELLCSVTKNDLQIFVPIRENKFIDYVIIDKNCYFLSGNFQFLEEILSILNIRDISNIQYLEYVNLIKLLKEYNLSYFDDIQTSIKNSLPENDRTIGLKAKLYEYQKKGFSWLKFMSEMNCGCILGDEMGLGKTLQIISLLGYLKEQRSERHYLVIAPVSLLENWRREFEKFYPSMKILVHHGTNRTGYYDDFLHYDVVLTSYSNVQSDLSIINMLQWDLVVLDEAQNIKNPYAKRTKTIKLINKKMGIAVTGTPFENHMTDIWSLIDFIIPNYFGSISEFERNFADTINVAETLEKFISPIMLRRKVKEVAKDLPERIDIPHPIVMKHEEAVFYDDGHRQLDEDPNLKELAIEKIQKLRMFCTHPMVYNNDSEISDPTENSSKYQLLCELIGEIVDSKEKVIIFTSFNRMNEILVNDLVKRFDVYTNCINGATPVKFRQKIIDEFSRVDDAAILILNPKAAGTGLNITAANHVIHYNLEWNPALEDQASARAYRRGQDKTVFIHRLFYINTIEEVINERIELKRMLADTVIVGNQGDINNSKDLLRALSLSPLDYFLEE